MKSKKEPTFRRVSVDDTETLLSLMREYYAYDHLKFDSRVAYKSLKQLLGNESLGCVWLIEEADYPVGYFVVTFWFSLEFHGKAAFLDELHIGAGYRGRGIGKRALAFAQEYCASQGVRALRVEVEHANIQALNLYNKSGFREHPRHLMTKWLDDSR